MDGAGLPQNSIDEIQGYFKDLFAIFKDVHTGCNSCDMVPSGRRLQGLISSRFLPLRGVGAPAPYAKYFLTSFTLISKMIKFDLSGADFRRQAEKVEPCVKMPHSGADSSTF